MVEPQSFYYGEYHAKGVAPFQRYKVYNLDDLIQYDKAYFYGCLKRKRDVLTKRDISEDDYHNALWALWRRWCFSAPTVLFCKDYQEWMG
jgi:hypothetical protein